MRALVLIALVAMLASGCGQRGPLYLRDQPPPGVTVPKSEPYEPVPYPPDLERAPETEKKK
jgi:predicted small lipoprotein YifL